MSKSYKYLYMAGVDVSMDTGAAINERGFVEAALGSEELILILPTPKRSTKYKCENVFYVFGHDGNAFRLLIYTIASAFRGYKLCRKHGIKLLVIRTGPLSIAPLIVSYLSGLPLAVKTFATRKAYSDITVYDLVSRSLWRSEWGRQIIKVKLLRKVLYLSDWLMVRKTIAVDLPSISSREIEITSPIFPLAKSVFIPNGAYLSKAVSPDNRQNIQDKEIKLKSTISIGYAGRLGGEGRYIKELATALARLAAKHKITAVFLGRGPDEDYIKKIFKEYGVLGQLIMPGWVDSIEMPTWYRKLDLAVDTTAVDVGHGVYGSFSQKIPQYLASGLPVVTWGLVDTEYIHINKLGFLADKVGCIASLENAVTEYTNLSEDSAREMSRNASLYANENFSNHATLKKRLTLWESVIADQY